MSGTASVSSKYGIDPSQLKARIIRPVLQGLDLWSIVAENLVLGTAMHESHLRYLQQIKGPARGIYQMEPATFNDIFANFLEYQPTLRQRINTYAIGAPDAEEMEGNLYFATAMCRVHYRRVKAPLPANVPLELAVYWKRFYNTELGKGTIDQALPHFWEACRAEPVQ